MKRLEATGRDDGFGPIDIRSVYAYERFEVARELTGRSRTWNLRPRPPLLPADLALKLPVLGSRAAILAGSPIAFAAARRDGEAAT